MARLVRIGPGTATGVAARTASLWGLFARHAERTPDATAVVAPDGPASRSDLARRARALAARLADFGGPIAVLAPASTAHVAAFLACRRAGAPYLPLDPAQTPLRARQILLQGDARALVCDAGSAEFAARLSSGRVPVLVEDPAAPEPPPTSWPEAAPDAPAAIFYTSGSTGIPKGVVHTERSLLAAAAKVAEQYALGPDDVAAVVAPPMAIGAILNFAAACVFGGASLSLGEIGAPERALLRRLRPQGVGSYAGIVHALCGAPDAADDLGRIRSAILFGDRITGEQLSQIRATLPRSADIHISYSLTEAASPIAWRVPRATASGATAVPIGHPQDGAETWIEDDRDDPAQGDIEGELLIAGERVATGYWRDPVQTAERFVPHPEDSARLLFRTGDVVRRPRSGPVEFLGRRDNQVKLRGWRIELEEIEAAACRAPGVARAAVAARRDTAGRVDALALYVAAAASGIGSTDATSAHLRTALPAHMVPSSVHFVSALPVTPTGKIDRVRLAEIDAQTRDAAAAPATAVDGWPDELCRRVAAILAAELRRAAIGPDDRFGRLGGDSLRALNAALQIEKVFGVEIDPADLLDDTALRGPVLEIAAQARLPTGAASDG